MLWLSMGLIALAALPFCFYLGALAILARTPKPVEPDRAAEPTRFVVVVPGHNEEQSIANTVKSLRTIDYPNDRYRIVVVADNCNDNTAACARSAGAEVLERHHDTDRGKGFALDFAFAHFIEDTEVDAFVVVDADTTASANLLWSFHSVLAEGCDAAQTEYGVSNPLASWRTKLMVIALAMFHRLRMLARERLKLSVGLRGNGMCFRRTLLQRIPHKAHGLVEDVEFGVQLGLADVRIAYAADSHVLGEMVSGGRAAVSQRQRWEGGRFQLLRTQVPRLVRHALRHRSWVALDLAVDILIPPLTYVAALACVPLVGVGGMMFTAMAPPTFLLPLALVNCTLLFLYIARGVQLSGFGLRGWLWLAWAPLYIVWKLVVAPLWARPQRWVRTQREGQERDEI